MINNTAHPYNTYATSPALSPTVDFYPAFPDAPCSGGGCLSAFVPRASVYLFASDRAPWSGAPALVPLYRMSKNGYWNSAFFYATTVYEVEDKGVRHLPGRWHRRLRLRRSLRADRTAPCRARSS